ncbi:Uncharacterized protein APZ42_032364 [Daphnia magna]|uniref:Uncharacterized protein n=1 Tax=Daphnia magna TaxID=35525 RepID=A0A164M1Z3_9CRUS|nr:Uncharacterized protein APZ42_032364 [Daphnia magna]
MYPWDWTLVCFKKRRYPDLTFVEYEIMDVVTECRPISYDKATYEIRKFSNCLAATTEADHNSFESWEIPPQPLGVDAQEKIPPFQRQKPVSHSDGKFGFSSHSSLTAVDGEFSRSLNGAADISKSEDESLHGDTGSIVGDNG